MQQNYKEYAQTLQDLLNLEGSPVAVKLAKKEAEVPQGYQHTSEVLRHCEMVQKARRGAKFYATVDQHACKGGAGVMGVIDIPENIKSGEFYYKLGRFASIEDARQVMSEIPHVDFQTYATVYAPLEEADFKPDVVVIVCTPHQAMVIAQANVYKLHSRTTADFSGIQSLCGDAVAGPLMRGTINLTLGCSGSRKYAKVSEDELIVGVPVQILPDLVHALQQLS